MPSRHNTEQPLSPELDAIAQAAADRLRAASGEDLRTIDEHGQMRGPRCQHPDSHRRR